jgi:hypothetical protein
MPAPEDASMREGVLSVRGVSPKTAFLTDVSAREMSVVEVSRLARVPVSVPRPSMIASSSSTNSPKLRMTCSRGRRKSAEAEGGVSAGELSVVGASLLSR